MISLIRMFALTSTLVVLVGAIATFVHRRTEIERLTVAAEQQNVTLTRAFANSVWPRFSEFVRGASGMDGAALRDSPEIREIDAQVKALSVGLPVIKVNIYTLDGTTVYSSEPAQIGEDKSNNLGYFGPATRGEPASKLTFRERFAAFGKTLRDVDIVESYLPIHGSDGRVGGVFELYSDVTPLMKGIRDATVHITVVSILVLGALCVIQFLFVRGANRTIRSQFDTITAHNARLQDEIREREQAVSALRESEQRFRTVVDNLPIGVCLKDLDDRYVLMNRQLAAWYGVREEDLLGRTSNDVFDEPDSIREARLRQERELLESGAPVIREEKTARADGLLQFVVITKFPVYDSNGNMIGYGSAATDITERKLMEDQLRRSQKMDAIGQVTGGVAHEFNNLLMAITGNLELVLDEGFQDKSQARALIEGVLNSAFRGKELTNRLLSYTGNPFDKPEVIDVVGAVVRATKFLRPLLGETIAVESALEPDLWPICVDPGEFESALANLAINARDAMPEGGTITFRCANASLDETFAAERPYPVALGDYVCVSVGDDGAGMSAAVVERAFDPFFTTKEVGKGTGLGLSMVYGFVHRKSGGYIDVESVEGEGTTVRLYFPRAQAEPSQRPSGRFAEDAAVYDWRSAADGRRSVLLVEDDRDVREMLARMLEGPDFSVLNARDGSEALTLLQQSGPVDLLLADVVLPGGISGVDLAERIQNARPETKVVLISGYAQEELAAKGVPEDRYTLLPKPFRKQELLDALKAVFADGVAERVDGAI